jgi:hypothetical protein
MKMVKELHFQKKWTGGRFSRSLCFLFVSGEPFDRISDTFSVSLFSWVKDAGWFSLFLAKCVVYVTQKNCRIKRNQGNLKKGKMLKSRLVVDNQWIIKNKK